MGAASRPQPVKLVIGFIFREDDFFLKAKAQLARRFGAIDFESPHFSFTYTDFYEQEMGKNLKRKFISFKKLISPQKLARIKTLTNRIETKLARKGCRRINIDPGYVNMAKLVLATTKDFSHRIYLEAGIFAEITLSFRGKSFQPGELTYPDYRTPAYIQAFNQIRTIYARQVKHSVGPRITQASSTP